MGMDVQTTQQLTAVTHDASGNPAGTVTIPAGAIILDIEFENPDPSVGIFQGTADGFYDGMFVDFGGTSWDWWGEPTTEPGGAPIAGWFIPYEVADWLRREKYAIAAEEVR